MLRFVLVLSLVAMPASAGPPSFDEQFWTLYGFTLNDDSLSAVHERLGTSPIFPVPEGHHERASCYTTEDDSVIAVFATGELGGGKQLLGVSLERQSLHNYSCIKPKVALPAEFPKGLRLGMAEKDFLKAAGVPFEKVDSTKLRRFADLTRKIPTAESDKRYRDPEITKFIEERGGMDVSQSFWVTLQKGKVVAFGVWKEETF